MRRERAGDRRVRVLTSRLASCANTNIVTSHTAFGYLTQRYGMTQVGISGLSPEEEPSPAELAEVTEFVRDHDVSTIYYETLVDPSIAETVADETGAATAVPACRCFASTSASRCSSLMTVVISMRVVGVLLVSALTVVPVATAQLVARSFRATYVVGIALGAAVSVAGVTASFCLDTPSGGTIVLLAIGLFAILLVAVAVVTWLR